MVDPKVATVNLRNPRGPEEAAPFWKHSSPRDVRTARGSGTQPGRIHKLDKKDLHYTNDFPFCPNHHFNFVSVHTGFSYNFLVKLLKDFQT